MFHASDPSQPVAHEGQDTGLVSHSEHLLSTSDKSDTGSASCNYCKQSEAILAFQCRCFNVSSDRAGLARPDQSSLTRSHIRGHHHLAYRWQGQFICMIPAFFYKKNIFFYKIDLIIIRSIL